MTTGLRVVGLYVYPVKSCKGRAVSASQVTRRGLLDDRLYMLVNWQGEFVTQREYPRLAFVDAWASNGELRLTAPQMPELSLQPVTCGPLVNVSIWSDECQAIDQGSAVSDWFSKYLDFPCRLVRMSDSHPRSVDSSYAQAADDNVSFADGFPILVTSTASLVDLNSRVGMPLVMERFRPNLVIEGCEPYAEDHWRRLRIGEWECRLVKPCARCKITTIDPSTALVGKEPLITLATYRRLPPLGVVFGQNAIPLGSGSISLGDSVEVLE